MDQYILRAIDISKSFAGVTVLDRVELSLEKGKVHALMGENGAGKSTFMNLLMGVYPPDEGQIFMRGREVKFRHTRDALHSGLSMIHQELMNFPELTVAQNIFMGKEPSGWGGRINSRKLNRDTDLLLGELGIDLRATTRMKALSVGEMQMVEIAKAVSDKAEVIIMDEPTSAISHKEVELLFRIINDLKRQGKAIVYISHRMDEIFRIADAITVLRDGKYIGTRDSSVVSMEELVGMIVGRELGQGYTPGPREFGAPVLQVAGLSGEKFTDIYLEVRQGEILGLAGLMGAGRTDIAEALFGMQQTSAGEVRMHGRPVTIRSPRDAIRAGMGLVSEDRKLFGLVLHASVKHNITLSSLSRYCDGPLLNTRKENEAAQAEIRRFGIRTSSPHKAVHFLSGGNQQKVVLSKVTLGDPDLVILDEPTRGVDVGAKAEIYRFIGELAAKGKAVLLISSELPELLSLSDRVLVIREGRIRAELGRAEATQELIMTHAMIN